MTPLPELRGGRPLLFGYVTDERQDPRAAADAVLVSADRPPLLVRQLRLGPVVCCVFRAEELEVVPHHASPGDGLAVGYVVEGRVRLEQDGRALDLGQGQVVLYHAATPYRISTEGPHEYVVVRVPGRLLRRDGLDTDPVVAADLSGSPSAAVLASLLDTVAVTAAAPSAAAAQHLGDAVVDCVHAVLAEHHETGASSTSRDLYDELTGWLDEHLADPVLSSDVLARAHFLSPRYVRRVFAQQGTTVSDYVRRRRLASVRADLLDARQRDALVSAVAHRWGFRDASVFSRAFSREFGESPQRFRRRHAGEAPPTDD